MGRGVTSSVNFQPLRQIGRVNPFALAGTDFLSLWHKLCSIAQIIALPLIDVRFEHLSKPRLNIPIEIGLDGAAKATDSQVSQLQTISLPMVVRFHTFDIDHWPVDLGFITRITEASEILLELEIIHSATPREYDLEPTIAFRHVLTKVSAKPR